MRYVKLISILGIVALLMILATREYIGYHYFYNYKEERTEARSIEGSFAVLEGKLKKALYFSRNPLFYKELAWLYLEMAAVQLQFGTAEKRDFYLDRAGENLMQVIRRNPIDAFAYYEMGKIYMLYNFPLLTYFDKAKLYFRKALEMKPADEFLNLNILYIYMTQWDILESEEKGFVRERLLRMNEDNAYFMKKLRNQWKKYFGNNEKLEDILAQLEFQTIVNTW